MKLRGKVFILSFSVIQAQISRVKNLTNQLVALPHHSGKNGGMSREDFQFQCPYCAENIWMEFYAEDGADQDTVIDCEVCCQPIHYRVRFKDDQAEVDVSREN